MLDQKQKLLAQILMRQAQPQLQQEVHLRNVLDASNANLAREFDMLGKPGSPYLQNSRFNAMMDWRENGHEKWMPFDEIRYPHGRQMDMLPPLKPRG